MPSPYTGSPTRLTSPANSSVEHYELINPLLGPVAWGSPFTLAAGRSYTLTYSFPWATSVSLATFESYYGDGEDKASSKFGLNASQQLSFATALQSWANVADISFSKISETSTHVGEIRIAFSSAVDEDTTAGAWAYYPSETNPSGGDIWLETKMASGSWEQNDYSFATLVHELGHTLGLSHPNDSPQSSSNLYTLMSYKDAPKSTWVFDIGNNYYSYRYVQPEGPQLHDILAIQYLYGPNHEYNKADTVYTFDPSIPFFRTLWDGGGKDTISASNFREPVTINLNAGTFSSLTIKSINPDINWTTPPASGLYDGTNNLAIAYGVIIENAIGGYGNDKLIGNSASNYLDGGEGNDELHGGDGNDYFDWDSAQRGGSDTFFGGKGDDVFVFDRSTDRAYERAGEGTDTIWVSFSYSLPSDQEIENLLGFGNNDLVLNGNSLNNYIKGSDGNDRVYGGGGNDTFESTKGQDTFDGGAGTDRLLLEKPRFSYIATKLSDDSYKLSLIGSTDTYTIHAVEEVQFGSVILRVSELVDTTAPTLLSATPADEATGVAIGANLVLTFSEAIAKGTGTLLLKNSAGTTIESFNVATSSAVTVSGSTLTVNPTNNLAYFTGYRLEIPAGAIKDTTGNSYSGTTAYNFATVARPDGLGDSINFAKSLPLISNVSLPLNSESIIGVSLKDVSTAPGNVAYAVGSFGGRFFELEANRYFDAFLLAIDTSTGSPIWARQLDSDAGAANALAVAPSGDLYVVGYTDWSASGYFGDQKYSSGKREGYIVKFSAQGDKLWSRLVDTGKYADYVSQIYIDNNGRVLISGTTDGGAFSGQAPLGGYFDGFLIEYSENGDFLWGKSFDDAILDFSVSASGKTILLFKDKLVILNERKVEELTIGKAPTSRGKIVIDSKGDIFITDQQTKLWKYSVGGDLLWEFTSSEPGRASEFQTGPLSKITTDQYGNVISAGVFVDSTGVLMSILQKVSPTGILLTKAVGNGLAGDVGAISADGQGNLIVGSNLSRTAALELYLDTWAVASATSIVSTRDEQDTGTGNLSSAYSDAPASTSTTFTLAIGQQNVAKGLLNPGLLADSDSYKLGELSAGNYKFTAKGSSWYSSSDFSGSVTPTLALHDSAGKVVATSSTGTLEYSVSAKGNFFLYVTGAGSQKSQYEVYFESVQAGKQFTGDEADNQIVGTAGSDVISAGGGNDVITGGAGDDTIDGGAGFDSAIWSGNSKNFEVSFNAGTWTVKDNSSGLGTDTVKNVENLQFTDRSVLIQSEAHGSYTDLPADLYQFFIVAFNAAPGVTYMNQLAEAYRFGLSVKEIVDIYVTKSQFTDLYPTTLTNEELAVGLVENIVKDSATASIKASAAEDMEAAMSVGYSRADVLYNVFGNLAIKPFTDPTWGNTAKFFANQIAVAKAYTEVMDQSTTDLATLRSALAAVTQDSSVATDSSAIDVVIDGLFGNSPPASANNPLGFASLTYSDEEDPDTTYPAVYSTDELPLPELEEPYRWVQYDVVF